MNWISIRFLKIYRTNKNFNPSRQSQLGILEPDQHKVRKNIVVINKELDFSINKSKPKTQIYFVSSLRTETANSIIYLNQFESEQREKVFTLCSQLQNKNKYKKKVLLLFDKVEKQMNNENIYRSIKQ